MSVVGWRTVELGEVSTSRLGKMLSPAAKVGGAELPYLGNAEVRWGSLRLDRLRTMSFSPKEQEEFSLCGGDVLICEGGEVGRTAVVDRDLPGIHFQKAIHRVRCSPELDPHYLYRYMQFAAPAGRLDDFSSEATIKHLTGVKLRKLPIPLPPIEEQQRIVAALDAADELRVKRRQAVAKLDTLTHALFIDMFGDLANNPKGWSVRPVSDFVRAFEAGKSVAAGPDDLPGGYRVLKVSAVTSREYRPDESKPVPVDYHPPSAHIVRAGDLLFSRANTTDLVGACAYVRQSPDKHLLPDKLWRFVWKEPTIVEPLYVWKALQNRRARKDIGDLATGSSGSMKNISQKKFMGLELPVPPVHLQQKFTRRFEELNAATSCARQSAALQDVLFASLQQRAFRGEL